MNEKEHINTLITTGATLPPVNPDLFDSPSAHDDDGSGSLTKISGKKRGKAPAIPIKTNISKSSSPDPLEYIAELERPEEDTLY